jgi:hypothetical protein
MEAVSPTRWEIEESIFASQVSPSRFFTALPLGVTHDCRARVFIFHRSTVDGYLGHCRRRQPTSVDEGDAPHRANRGRRPVRRTDDEPCSREDFVDPSSMETTGCLAGSAATRFVRAPEIRNNSGWPYKINRWGRKVVDRSCGENHFSRWEEGKINLAPDERVSLPAGFAPRVN